MPFMLKACGHALRYSKPEGICGRCTNTMDVEDGSHEGPDSDVGMNAENEEPVSDNIQQPVADQAVLKSTKEASKQSFPDQVDKLVCVMVNSEGSELNDAVTHIARNMSTFTAGERGDFVYELVIKYCEARREDQPKIDILLKELAKKNVLAKPHFLHSVKRIVADTASLVVDWPNIYDCTVNLVGTNLSHLKAPTENLEALAKALKNAPSDHAAKYLVQLRRHFPHVTLPDPKSAKHPQPARPTVGFLLSPAAAKDKFIRPVGQRPPRQIYSRDLMLAIKAKLGIFPLPEGLLASVKRVNEQAELPGYQRAAAPRDLGALKRPRFISESGTGGEPAVSTKRMLESTSPPLLLERPQRGSGEPRYHRDSASSSFTGASLTGFDRPRFVSESMHAGPAGPSFPVSPKKSYHEHPYAASHHRHHEAGSKPRYNSVNMTSPIREHVAQSRGSPSRVATAPVVPVAAAAAPPVSPTPGAPIVQPTAVAAAAAPAGPTVTRPGSGKTKKFLTALNVERITETDVSPLSPTLSPNVKTWSRGSGSFNTSKPGFGGPSPSKDTKPATSPMTVPRVLGLSHHHKHKHGGHRGSPGNGSPIGDHVRKNFATGGPSPGTAGDGSPATTKLEPDGNWRRGLSQA